MDRYNSGGKKKKKVAFNRQLTSYKPSVTRTKTSLEFLKVRMTFSKDCIQRQGLSSREVVLALVDEDQIDVETKYDA